MNNEVINLRVKDSIFTYNNSHFQQHPGVLANIQEALEKVVDEFKAERNDSFIKKTVELNKIIGKREAIELTGDEDIYYAQRIGRRTLTKFVRGVKQQDCSAITFVVSKVNEKKFRLITAYIGYQAEKEPLDPAIKTEEEFNRAKDYWNKTAMIDGTQEIYMNTITKDCPWDNFENRIVMTNANNNNIQAKIDEIRKKQNISNQRNKLAA